VQGRPFFESRAWAWFRLLHPFPSTLVTVATAVFAELATGGQAPLDRLLRLILSVACSQGAIGAANDIVDRDLDRETKPWKPIARGTIGIPAATTLTLVLIGVCLLCSATLSTGAGLAALLGLSCGLAYDLWLKRSRWSWLPYGVALPTLPIWAWAAMGRLPGRLLLVYPLGLLLGLALHLANTLPDLDGDRIFGVAGLAHGLGRGRSLLLCWSALILAQLGTLVLAPVLSYHGPAYPVGLAVSLGFTLLSMLLYRRRPTTATLQLNFGVIAFAALALAIGWLASAL
jgi:geranylgeranylglycerol-phosphate geranylgeranyltransferase